MKKKSGPRMFEAAELQRIIESAPGAFKAMTLLGVNGGLGNHDVAALKLDNLDIDGGWLDFPRPKTGIDRKIPLWPETVAAIKAWLAVRPEPRDEQHAGLLFVTKYRQPWVKQGRLVEVKGQPTVKGIDDAITKGYRKLLDSLGINGSRNFYALRHTFETIAGDTGDQVAVNAIMGHADQSMASHYRERIDPERLRRVVEHVRQWLFQTEKDPMATTTSKMPYRMSGCEP